MHQYSIFLFIIVPYSTYCHLTNTYYMYLAVCLPQLKCKLHQGRDFVLLSCSIANICNSTWHILGLNKYLLSEYNTFKTSLIMLHNHNSDLVTR